MEFTKEQIEAYKKQHGTIFMYTTKEKDPKSCILKAPSLTIIDACRSMSMGSSIKFDEQLLKNCWVAGDQDLLEIDKYKMGIFDWISKIIVVVSGKLEEL